MSNRTLRTDAASRAYRDAFGGAPLAAASAPGRVNLIGEHTDYNDGYVLPIPIARRTVAVAGAGAPGVLELVSTRDGAPQRVEHRRERGAGWGAYVVGVVRELVARGVLPEDAGARLAVASDVPVGAGVASSAALTVAAGAALARLAGARLAPRDLADVAYHAEHDHVGVRCGRMDQTVSALGRPGHALLLDCAALAAHQIPFAGRLLLVDSGVRHELAASAFNERRAQCEAALAVLRGARPDLTALGALGEEDLAWALRRVPAALRPRVRHVVTESARTVRAARALAAGRLREFGRLMYASHESCRRFYECSAPELDVIVRAARHAGAWGARLTGAGWGGAVLVLVGAARRGARVAAPALLPDEARIAAAIAGAFERRFGRTPAVSRIATGAGARVERLGASLSGAPGWRNR